MSYQIGYQCVYHFSKIRYTFKIRFNFSGVINMNRVKFKINILLASIVCGLFILMAVAQNAMAWSTCIVNSMSAGAGLYLKVGYNGGGLSEGFITGDQRCWAGKSSDLDGPISTATVYACTTALTGASCDYLGTFDAYPGAFNSTLQITGNTTSGISCNISAHYRTSLPRGKFVPRNKTNATISCGQYNGPI